MHDVLVIGGSLAGAATAIHLVESGHDVVLLERHSTYQRKTCGEGLSPLGVAELTRLGVLDALTGASQPLSGVRFNAGDASAMAPLGAGPGLGVQRTALDCAVLDRARTAGVDIRLGVTARKLLIENRQAAGVTTDSGDIRARTIIGADGLNSRIRREAGLDARRRGNRFGISAHLRLSREPEHLVDVFFERGYELYLTPVGDSVVNAAMLIRRTQMKRFAGKLAAEYTATLREHPVLSAGFEVIDQPLAAGPFAARAKRAWRANVVLVGDAAGFFDGISGEGMSVALISARACAEAVEAHLRDGSFEPFRAYDRHRREMVRNSDLLSHVSLALGSNTALAHYAVRNLARRPETFAKLAGINSGELGLRILRPRDLLALTFGF
ncbi:MAG: NAD(P)/FAD-dependent oxidoreductase [Tepidiformaceae bacterium]